MTVIHSTADTLLCLLNHEVAAYEAYRHALAQRTDQLHHDSLLEICREHLSAVEHLRLHAQRYGGSPDEEAAAWDGLLQAVESTDTIVGNIAALTALRDGERQGLMKYIEVAGDSEIPSECRNLIRLTLLPHTENHIVELDRLIEISE